MRCFFWASRNFWSKSLLAFGLPSTGARFAAEAAVAGAFLAAAGAAFAGADAAFFGADLVARAGAGVAAGAGAAFVLEAVVFLAVAIVRGTSGRFEGRMVAPPHRDRRVSASSRRRSIGRSRWWPLLRPR